MTQKLRMPHELRPAYYPRIAQKYREMDLEDPTVCDTATTMALEELNKCKALDSMFIFYRLQAEMLGEYAGFVWANARMTEVDPPAEDQVDKRALMVVGSVVVLVIPAVWYVGSSLGSFMSSLATL